MRAALRSGMILLLAGVGWAADAPTNASAPVSSTAVGSKPATSDAPVCGSDSQAPSCPVLNLSPTDLKLAHRAFVRGLKLQKAQDMNRAFSEFEEAARLAPQDTEYLAAREMTRQHLVGMHIEQGNADLRNGRKAEGVAEFRTALDLDPQNEFAQLRLSDALDPLMARAGSSPQVVASADSLVAKPTDARHDIHFRGDSRGLITAVASSYGLTVVFDDSVPSRPVRFDIEDADFATAMHAVSAVTKTFSVALEDKVILTALDNTENHRVFDRMGMRSFYISNASSPTELNEFVNTLRTMFEFKFLMLNSSTSTITVRGPIAALEAATKLMAQLNAPPPEVLFDLQLVEVDSTYMSNYGVHLPNKFNLYNIPAAALVGLGGQNIQQLINQLIASGGINQAGNSTISQLLSELEGGSSGSGIFSQPLATFGGGLTLMGLSLDQLSAVLSLNEAWSQTIDHVTLRAGQQKEATFKLGSRYPVMNASFAPLSNSSAIAGVIQNQSYTAPFPSINYEDLGLTLKAKPLIHNNSDVAVDLSIQIRALGSTQVNGVPIITNREYTGGILLKDGEPAVVAGMISTTDENSIDGLPTFAQIPGFGVLASQRSHSTEDDEIMIVLTPHVVRDPMRSDAPPIWLPK